MARLRGGMDKGPTVFKSPVHDLRKKRRLYVYNHECMACGSLNPSKTPKTAGVACGSCGTPLASLKELCRAPPKVDPRKEIDEDKPYQGPEDV